MVNFVTKYWQRDWSALHYVNLVRFGFELLLYGFVLGFSGLLHMQSQAHQHAIRSLELEKQLSQAQLKALQMQLEPHFLFNTLNAVTTLVELRRKEEAAETLAHLKRFCTRLSSVTLRRRFPSPRSWRGSVAIRLCVRMSE